VWSADDVPVIRANDSIVLPDTAPDSIDATIPVFDIAKRFGIGAIDWEIVYPSAAALDDRDAALLGLDAGRPALTMQVVGVGRTGATAYWASELHATDAFQYTMIRLIRG
jgi:GntR family transcriptional regulator